MRETHARTCEQVSDGTPVGTRRLLLGECTVRLGIVPAGAAVIARRVAVPSHAQTTFDGEGGLITVGGGGRTIRPPTARCAGDRKRRIGRAAHKGGGEVIADHPPLARIGEPGDRHGAGHLRTGGPRGSAVRRGREAGVQLAGRGRAVGVGVEVEDQGQVGAATSGRVIHAQAGEEVVDPAADRIERDARHRCPIAAVGGGAEDQVIGRAAGFKTAVRPGDVDGARGVDLGRGQRVAGAQVADWSVESDLADFKRFAPARSAVRGDEGQDEEVAPPKAQNRHYHGPARLHQGLAAEAVSVVLRGLPRAPRQSAVAGDAHLDQVAQGVVVKLGVAVAEEGAAGRVIADRPVLVVKVSVIIDDYGSAPGQPAIGRAAHIYIDFRGVAVWGDAQVRDQPDPVPGVERHRGVADRRVDARRGGGGGGTGQEAVFEAAPSVAGGGEADIGGAAAEDAAHLEGRHERAAGGKGIRLDFRGVLAGPHRKRVAAQLEQAHAGKSGKSRRE